MNKNQDVEKIDVVVLETITGGGAGPTIHFPLGGRVEINQQFNFPKSFRWSHPFWGTWEWGG